MRLWAVVSVIDNLCCLLLLFPLAIFHWRGTWDLLDVYIFPENENLSSWTTLAIGVNVCMLGYLLQPAMLAYLGGPSLPQKVVYCVSLRLFMYLSAWGVLCFWRGVWNLLDDYLTPHWVNSAILYAVIMAISLILRCSRTHVGLPVSIQTDCEDDILVPLTQFNVPTSKIFLYSLDCLFTQVVTVTFNVTVWRGIWNICDTFIYPEDLLKSDLFSLGAGYAITALFMTLQCPLAAVSVWLERKHQLWKLVYEDVVFLIVGWSVLLMWRGGWDLCVAYVIPDKVVGGWTCHCIGSIGLIVTQALNCVAFNSIEKDGAFSNGEGIFPVQYLRKIFQTNFQGTSAEEELLITAAYHADSASEPSHFDDYSDKI